MTDKILVIEDVEALRKDIIEMLTLEGYEVRGAENGVKGLEEARQFRPDLIISDIMMPEMDGFTFLDRIQQEANGVMVPFIFLTAKSDRSDHRLGMLKGANDYITKPFTAQELIGTVRTQLNKYRSIHRLIEDRLNELRRRIILTLPHELRTPLTSILGFSDIMEADCEIMERDKIGSMARHINDAARRLYRLTENYLLYAHLELLLSDPQQVQTMQHNRTPNPRAVIEDEVIMKAQEYRREADLVFDTDCEATVRVFEDNLKKIVEELADNAFKFSDPATPVSVNTAIVGDNFVLTVLNQGREIAGEDIQSVGAYMQFNRDEFEQQGSGFGLVLVRRLAELYGGALEIESGPEHKTRVAVFLPLAPDDPEDQDLALPDQEAARL